MSVLDTFRNPPDIDALAVPTLPPVNQMPPAALITGGSNFCARAPDVYGNNAYFNCLDVINLHVWNPPPPNPWTVASNNTPLTTTGGTFAQSTTGWSRATGGFPSDFYTAHGALPVLTNGIQFTSVVNGLAEIDLQISCNLALITGATVGQTLVIGVDFPSFVLGNDFGQPLLIPYFANTGFIVARAQWIMEWNMSGNPPQTMSPPRYFITGPTGANITIANQLLKLAFLETF
jgi:hypothetical protein